MYGFSTLENVVPEEIIRRQNADSASFVKGVVNRTSRKILDTRLHAIQFHVSYTY